MKTQTISYSAVCACGLWVALAVLLGGSSNAQTQSPAHASNSPEQKLSKPASAPARTATPVRYRITDLGNLGSDSLCEANGINNKGQIVGRSALPGHQSWHAFLYENGKMTDLGLLPGCFGSNATGINNQGAIVGISRHAVFDMIDLRSFVYNLSFA